MILDEGELISTITDSIVKLAALMRLAQMVEIRSDKMHKLFCEQA